MTFADSTRLLVEYEKRFRDDLRNKKRSLFLSALSLTDGEKQAIKEALATVGTNQPFRHIRMALYLLYFHSHSNGWKFSYWDSMSNNANVTLEKSWEEAYGSIVDVDNAHIKSKCWILNSAESGEGKTSEVWQCLRDAIHSYQNNDGDITVSNQKKDDRRFMTLLQSAPDSIEWREYCRLVEILARQERPEEEPWRTLAEKCRSILGSYAYFDWYLRLERDKAKYVVGFDWFPSGGLEADWTNFQINGKTESIKSRPAWFHWIPWDHPVEVVYAGTPPWNTLNPSDESCFFSSAQRPYGVFVRYRSENGERGKWWTKDTSPQMSISQTEFLVCARDNGKMEKLHLSAEGVAWELKKEGTLSVTSPDADEKTKFPYRIYKITNRPTNADTVLSLWEGNPEEAPGSQATITVIGKKASACAVGNSLGIQLTDTPKSMVTFPSETLRLQVRNERQNGNYEWEISLDGKKMGEYCGSNVELAMSKVEAPQTIQLIDIKCTETVDGHTRRLPRMGGVFLPNAVRGSIVAETQLPANWNWKDSGTSPIADRLEGFKKWKIEDPNGRQITIGKPDAELAWWFEKSHYWNEANTEMYRASSPVREFQTVSEARALAMGMPPKEDDPCPEGWSVMESGYWRCDLQSLVDKSDGDFRYDPDAKLYEYRNEDGIVLFRYRFSPDKPLLCLCKNGSLGLFVPEGDAERYDIYAFSDKTKELLVSGQRLATTQPGTVFMDIQPEWDNFCRETDGWDAVLVVFPASDSAHCLLRSLSFIDYRLRQGSDSAYDAEHLEYVPFAKVICGSLPESHPARKMWFYRTHQEASYDVVREKWAIQLEDMESFKAWKTLTEKWIASEFNPWIEGLVDAFHERAKACYLKDLPPTPSGIDNGLWHTFVQKCLEGQAVLGCDDMTFKEMVKALGVNEKKQRKEVFDRISPPLSSYVSTWSELNLQWSSTLCPPTSPRIKLSIKTLSCATGEIRLNEFKHQIPILTNNYVSRGWCSIPKDAEFGEPLELLNEAIANEEQWFEIKEQTTMEEAYDMRQSRNRMGRAVKAFLSNWSGKRYVGGKVVSLPTDKEWLFCISAVASLFPPQVEIPTIRRTLTRVLNMLREADCREGTTARWNLLAEFRTVCENAIALR